MMSSKNIKRLFGKLGNNWFINTIVGVLLLLCLYQTWYRVTEKDDYERLGRKLSLMEDRRYLLKQVPVSQRTADSLARLHGAKLLVLRFIKNDCHQCTDSTFSNLKRIASVIGEKNIAVLIGNSTQQEFYTLQRLNQQQSISFFYFPEQVGQMDKDMTSYFFISSGRREVASLSLLTRPLDFPIATKEYLNSIKILFQ